MLGMVSGLISDSQITASNQGDRNWMPENVRLVTSRSGWALPPASHPYTNEWLQVDLGEEKVVRGIIVQGGKHRENKVFMKKFKIGHSHNGSDWKMIMDDSKRKAKVRTGQGPEGRSSSSPGSDRGTQLCHPGNPSQSLQPPRFQERWEQEWIVKFEIGREDLSDNALVPPGEGHCLLQPSALCTPSPAQVGVSPLPIRLVERKSAMPLPLPCYESQEASKSKVPTS